MRSSRARGSSGSLTAAQRHQRRHRGIHVDGGRAVEREKDFFFVFVFSGDRRCRRRATTSTAIRTEREGETHYRIIYGLMATGPTLFLIDGSNQMYRAYHAIRGLTRSDGKSTNATYGFITMLRKLLADHQPQYIAASFDLRGPTFRSEDGRRLQGQPLANAGRPGRAGALGPRSVRGDGRADLTSEGFEADDVIGTLATQGRRPRPAGGDRHRRQGFLPAGPRRHSRLQPAATKAPGTTPTACCRSSASRRRRCATCWR